MTQSARGRRDDAMATAAILALRERIMFHLNRPEMPLDTTIEVDEIYIVSGQLFPRKPDIGFCCSNRLSD